VRSNKAPIKSLILKALRNLIGMLFSGESLSFENSRSHLVRGLCAQVAIALRQPWEKISIEMVFRGLKHFAMALERGDAKDVIEYFQTHHKLLALVKAERKRHRQRDAIAQQVWGVALALS
jgi:hypothetical protein